MTSNFKYFLFGISISGAALMSGCGEGENNEVSNEVEKIDKKIVDTTGNVGPITIGGQIFSIPSPVQTAFLIKDENASFSSEYLNSPSNVNNYSSPFLKALNMGVYGADLGYLTIYDKNDDAMKYLKAVRDLSKDLGLDGAFDDKLAERFSNNIGNKDSMLVFVSEAYTNSDKYLKENDKDEVAAIVLAGGWLESLHIACQAALETKSRKIIERIGEQKRSLESIIAMLNQFSTNQDYDDLVTELEDLYTIYNGITFNYEFVAPVTDEGNKVTTIKSKNIVNIDDAQLEAIIQKISAIRDEITA